jgi:phenylpropionate dioxygenase-like ring-hydroxylating dioxygenase large terminal subunit
VPALRTLPWSWYSDPEILRREQERIFRRAWQYVGHAGQVKDVGDRFAAWAGDVPVLVLRAEEGIRAFLNVCRHRGSLLAESAGTGKSIQCPYHAWTYALDGSLRAAPRSEREEGFDTEGLSLVPLRLETWGPFCFVNPDADAPPLAETLGPVPGFVPVDDLVFHSRDDYELAANWKIGCENYLECYHCPVAHKGFSAAYDVDPDEYRLEPTGEHVLSQFANTREAGAGQAQFHFVWPNLRINVFAGTPNLSIGPLLPAGPERSTGFLDYFFAPDATGDWVEELLAFDRQVGAEDRVLVERVQKGVSSGILDEGRLLDQSEQLVARFQELVGTALS